MAHRLPLGESMRIIIGTTILCGLLAAASAQAQDQAAAAKAPTCKLQRVTSLDMTLTPDGITVPVVINGTPKNFKLDLASSPTYIAQDAVDDLKLPVTDLKKPANYNGHPVKQTATVAKFQIGIMAADNQPISVLPAKTLKEGEAGTLGAALLANMDFEMDFANHKFNLFSAEHCPGQVVYWTNGAAAQIPYEHDPAGHLVIAMTLDDKPIAAGISGNAATLMTTGTLSQMFDLHTDAPGMTKISATEAGLEDSSEFPAYGYHFKTLSTAGVTIQNPQLVVYGLRQSATCNTRGKDPMEHCIGQPDIFLGAPTLSKFHLYFSSKEKLMYLTAADAH